jgi:hypothetical protein
VDVDRFESDRDAILEPVSDDRASALLDVCGVDVDARHAKVLREEQVRIGEQRGARADPDVEEPAAGRKATEDRTIPVGRHADDRSVVGRAADPCDEPHGSSAQTPRVRASAASSARGRR